MKEAIYGELSIIAMRGCEPFVAQVDNYLKEWRRHGGDESFIVNVECPRFGTGEGKALLHDSLRGHD
ncbi:MAG: ribose-phosphate pyrophosphokinase, partial [Clostridia bacterium]|nr:ribose-phosphate pyrophosphokinase [Clostridia bacterium]